jgi:hypothetical protein
MALTKTIQAVFEGSPVTSTYKPVKAEVTTLLIELTNGSLPLFTMGGVSALGTVAPGALAFGTQNNVTVTPNATGTFTSTVAPAGTLCALKITTSGTTSFTLTFGTGFKTTGTLATGTVTAKVFMLTFWSDGTTLNEISRTAAM